jgi:hypothetical protein
MTTLPSARSALSREDVRALEGQSLGPVSLPGDATYAEDSATFNLSFAGNPAVVVGATAPGDVVAAVRFARQRNLPVGVMATGHQASQPTEGAVLINTRRMNSIAIDASARVARVAAVHLIDVKIRSGMMAGIMPVEFPHRPGWDVAGVVDVPIGRTYPLREAASAHADLESGRNHGKIILLP